MSVICAMKEPGVGVWIGGDTQATAGTGNGYATGHIDKWIVQGNRAVGVCGAVSLLSALSSEPDLMTVSDDPFNFYMAVLRALREFDVAVGEDGKIEGSMILVLDNNIWSIDPLGGCIPHKKDMAVMGSGAEFALGAGYIAGRLGLDTKNIIRSSIDAAIKYSVYCGGKVWTRCLKSN